MTNPSNKSGETSEGSESIPGGHLVNPETDTPSQKPYHSTRPVPLTPEEAASLRAEMKAAMDWAEKELDKS